MSRPPEMPRPQQYWAALTNAGNQCLPLGHTPWTRDNRQQAVTLAYHHWRKLAQARNRREACLDTYKGACDRQEPVTLAVPRRKCDQRVVGEAQVQFYRCS